MDKKILIEGVDTHDLKQILKEVVDQALKKHLVDKNDQYRHIPEQLSTKQVQKYFGITQHRIIQLRNLEILNPINIGSQGSKRPTYKYLKSEVIDYIDRQRV